MAVTRLVLVGLTLFYRWILQFIPVGREWYEFRVCFFFSSRRRHTRCSRDWSSDVCSSDLWRARSDLGTFPIRFPSPDDPGDAGWHVDNSFPHDSSDTGDFLNWRINVVSKGRALLMLFLLDRKSVV